MIKYDEEIIEIMYQAAREKTETKDTYAESVLATLQSRLEELRARRKNHACSIHSWLIRFQGDS